MSDQGEVCILRKKNKKLTNRNKALHDRLKKVNDFNAMPLWKKLKHICQKGNI